MINSVNLYNDGVHAGYNDVAYEEYIEKEKAQIAYDFKSACVVNISGDRVPEPALLLGGNVVRFNSINDAWKYAEAIAEVLRKSQGNN